MMAMVRANALLIVLKAEARAFQHIPVPRQ